MTRENVGKILQVAGACLIIFGSGMSIGANLPKSDDSASWRDLSIRLQETSAKWEGLYYSKPTAPVPCYSSSCGVLSSATVPASLPIVGCMVFNDKGTMDRLRIPGLHAAPPSKIIDPVTNLPMADTSGYQMGSCRAYDDATGQWVQLRNPKGFVPPAKP